MAIHIIWPARYQSINLAFLDPRILDRIGDRFDQQPDSAAPRYGTEAALPHADDHIFILQIPGHQITPSWRSNRRASWSYPSSARISSVCSPSSGGALRCVTGVSASVTPLPLNWTCPIVG